MNRVLEEQKHYYRERASEYDESFYRIGRYDRGLNHWFDGVSLLPRDLARLGRFDSLLEPACGTGIWTQALAAMNDHDVTVIDASTEVIEISRPPSVDYLPADLFEWQPARN